MIDLLTQNLYRSYDVAKKYKLEETFYHVFKKNQIGGVREILILPITNRIRINILETLSRNICQFDKREILTHGAQKYESIKSCLYTSKKYEGSRAPIHITMDKSRWGPGFIPFQFFYLFSAFKEELGTMYYYIIDILIRHQNKKCILPERLMKAWHIDTRDKYTHRSRLLQAEKEKFKKNDGRVAIDNKSNMGQGILHFTSSYLHLAMIQFRDELYKRMCKRRGYSFNDHEDLLSSDDSYTIFCPELNKTKPAEFVRNKLTIFLKAQRISEILFNCRTSLTKSSINPLIGEFNSLFLSNMTFMPTLLKFALSSVHPVNTDSFFRMVKESYSSCRQIVENGGGLDLYLLASTLNKNYCEEMYHTNKGGFNDLTQFDISKFPYHLGHYPIFSPSLMIMFGPEFYNYKLYRKEFENMNEYEKKLFITSHKVIKGGLIDTMAEFEDGDTVLGGLLRIEASIGPIRQLLRIQKNTQWDRTFIENMIEKNPLLIIKQPVSNDEITFKTIQKLYTTGSAEAMKNIAASIYYGRVSATISAHAFYVPHDGGKEVKTYKECLMDLLKEKTDFENFDKQIKFLYPKFKDYELFLEKEFLPTDYIPRNPFEIQTIQSLSTHKINSKLSNSVPDVLDVLWNGKRPPEGMESKFNRDVEIIKIHYPMIKDSMEETIDQFKGEHKDNIKSLLLLLLKLYSLKDRSFKGVIYGLGSGDVVRTYEQLTERNSSLSHRARLHDLSLYKWNETVNEMLYTAYNHSVLSILTESKVENPWNMVDNNDIDLFMGDPSINKNIKKRVMMVALHNGKMANIQQWTKKTSTILHFWTKRQKFNDDKTYVGDFEITFFLGSFRMIFFQRGRKLNMYKSKNLDDPETIYLFLLEFLEVMSWTLEYCMSLLGRGEWVITDKKVIKVGRHGSFEIIDYAVDEPISFSNCNLIVNEDRMILYDEYGFKLYAMDTGLLTTYATVSDKYDFQCYGLSFKKLCEFNCFNQNFSVLYKSRTETIDILDDLKVERPKISEQTKKRLNLPDWEMRVETRPNINVEDSTTFMMDLIEMKQDELESLNVMSHDQIDDMIGFIMSTDACKSMMTTQRLQQTSKLLRIIQNLKYDLICHHVLTELRINKSTIETCKGLILNGNKRNILYSLISYYDRLYAHEEHQSPKEISFSISKEIIEKFDIRLNFNVDDDWDLDSN